MLPIPDDMVRPFARSISDLFDFFCSSEFPAFSLVDDKDQGESVLRRFPALFDEIVGNVGKARVALDLRPDDREIDPVCDGQEVPEYRFPAEHEGLAGISARRQRRRQVVHHNAPFSPVSHLAGDNDVRPSGEGPPDALVGLSAHDERMVPGDGAEPFEIEGQAPGHFISPADDPVLIHGCDDGDDHTNP